MDEGHVVMPGMFTRRETEHLRAAVESLPVRRAGLRHVLRHHGIRRIAEDPRLLHLATRLLGASAIPFKATLFTKSKQSNWLVPWHQDLSLPVRTRVDVPGWGPWSVKDGQLYALAPAAVLERVIALRVHVDDSRTDNGPLRVLSGTHRLGRLSEDAIAALARDSPQVECVVASGGVVAMRPLTVHASSKAMTDAPRRVLHIEYAAALAVDGALDLAAQ